MSVRRHTIYNLGGSLVPLALSLVTVPIYLGLIGLERYGVLALVWLLLGYFGLFDLGLSRATAQRIASLGSEQAQEKADTFWTAVIINIGIGAIGGALIYLVAALFFGAWFEISPELRGEFEIAFYLLILAVPVATLSGVLTGALQGASRFWEINLVAIFGSAAGQLLPLGAAYAISPSLDLLVATAMAARLATLAIMFLACRKHVFHAHAPRFSHGLALELLRFGGWITLTALVGPLMTMLDRFVIGASLGAKSVTYYAVPYQLADRTSIVPASLTSALFPRFSAASLEEDPILLEHGLHALATATTLPFVVAFFCINPFLGWWIGPDFAASVGPVGHIVLFGFWANGFARILGARLQARGQPHLVAISHLFQLPVYLAALFGGLALLGLTGAALATSVRMLGDGLILAWLNGHLTAVAGRLALPFLMLTAALAASLASVAGSVPWWSAVPIAGLAAVWSLSRLPLAAMLRGQRN